MKAGIGNSGNPMLNKLLLIHGSGASPATKRMMLASLQKEVDGEQLKVQFTALSRLEKDLDKIEAEKKRNKPSEDGQVNEHGDTVVISNEARAEYDSGTAAAAAVTAPATEAPTS